MNRITELTPEQRAQLEPWAQRWIATGLSTEPADWDTWEEGARECYAFAGIPWPGRVERVGSPLALAQALPRLLADMGSKEDPAWSRYLGGAFWSAWSAWRGFFIDVCGLELAPDIIARHRAWVKTLEAGWWWPHSTFVVVSDRPSEVRLEAAGTTRRLHSETGPAIAWRDGWQLHFLHGVRVPAEIVEHPETLTPASIMAIGNTEVRRVAIEQYGWPQFVVGARLRLLDAQPDPANPGHPLELYEPPRDLLGYAARVLLCTNASPDRDGTRRRFGLTVPVTCADALAAAAWTFDVTPDAYRELAGAT